MMKMTVRKISASRLGALCASVWFTLSLVGIVVLLLQPLSTRGAVIFGGPFISWTFTSKDFIGVGIIFHLLVNGFVSWLLGLLAGWGYNVWAKFFGGLTFEISEADQAEPSKPLAPPAAGHILQR